MNLDEKLLSDLLKELQLCIGDLGALGCTFERCCSKHMQVITADDDVIAEISM